MRISAQVPFPIAHARHIVAQSVDLHERARALVATLDRALNTICILALADYAAGPPDTNVEARLGSLDKPPTGHDWLDIICTVAQALDARNTKPFFRELPEWAQSAGVKDVNEAKRRRNAWAHPYELGLGAVMQQVRDLEYYVPALLESVAWLDSYTWFRLRDGEVAERPGWFAGKVQPIVADREVGAATSWAWTARLLKGPVYCTTADRKGILELTPFVQVLLRGKSERLFWFARWDRGKWQLVNAEGDREFQGPGFVRPQQLLAEVRASARPRVQDNCASTAEHEGIATAVRATAQAADQERPQSAQRAPVPETPRVQAWPPQAGCASDHHWQPAHAPPCRQYGQVVRCAQCHAWGWLPGHAAVGRPTARVLWRPTADDYVVLSPAERRVLTRLKRSDRVERTIERTPYLLAGTQRASAAAAIVRDREGFWLALRGDGPPLHLRGQEFEAWVMEPAVGFSIGGLEFLLADPT